MVQVRWTREAINNLELIQAYIRAFDPRAARRMAERLIAAGNSLRDFPERGRPSGQGSRELVGVAPYVIRYEVDDDGVRILRGRHGARAMD